MIGELAGLGAAISWTVSALLYKKALENASPLSANIIRLAATGSILMLLLLSLGKLALLVTMPVALILLASVSGIIGLGVGDTLYFLSLRAIGVSRSVPLACIYPLFNVLWAAFLLGEHITFTVVLGAVTIVIGIFLLGQNSEENKVARKVLIIGMAMAIGTALTWSVSIAMMDVAVKEAPGIDYAFVINIVRVTSIAAAMLAVSPVIDRKLGFLQVRKKTVVILILSGIVALGAGWFLLSYGLTLSSQARVVPISSTTPLFSTLAGIMLLHERANARNVLGAILIVAGIFLVFLT